MNESTRSRAVSTIRMKKYRVTLRAGIGENEDVAGRQAAVLEICRDEMGEIEQPASVAL